MIDYSTAESEIGWVTTARDFCGELISGMILTLISKRKFEILVSKHYFKVNRQVAEYWFDIINIMFYKTYLKNVSKLL